MKFDIAPVYLNAAVRLNNPFPNGAPEANCYDEIIAVYKEIKAKLDAGERVYVGYTTGERAGSIAYIKEVETAPDRIIPQPRHRTGWHWDKNIEWDCYVGFPAVLGWEKRRNKVKCSIGRDMVYFPNYTGPTIWEKFDKKAAEKAAAEEVIVKDRDGNVLAIGDRVLYINARYGGAAQLDRGTISDIKVKINKYRNQTYSQLNVLIDNDIGEQSKITGPDLSVLKI